MPFIDAMEGSKKHKAMQDTWGHLYPEPGKTYYGEMLIAVGEYGDLIIVKSDFPGLEYSPQRFELAHSIFNLHRFDEGIHRIKCGMFFADSSNEMYLEKGIGKLINVASEEVL